MTFSRSLKYLPFSLPLIGAILIVVAGQGEILAVALAAVYLAGGVALVLWQQQLANGKQRLVETYLDGQQHFSDEVSQVWGRHIESSRAQMESAISALSARFSGIVDRLDQAVYAASTETQSVQGGGQAIVDVFAKGEQELGAIVRTQKASLDNTVEMLEKVQNMSRFVSDLKDMASEVAKIAQQTNLLSLNAAIEASRSGEQGRGFAVVASEFRMLSRQSGDTGRRIAERVSSIQDEILAICKEAGESVNSGQVSMGDTEASIGKVMDDFRVITQALERSSANLQEESVGIQHEVNQALVELQFQDRVSQMMTHVKANIDRFPSYVAEHRLAIDQEGALRPVDATELLGELQKTYVMEDQHVIHQGGTVSQKKSTGITFF